ncbi:MAG: branched-chain amino acid ABC transporter permease [Sphingomonadaceae bacterium]
MIWLNQIIQGVLLGGYYALIACGLSFMFGVMRIINLAHGDLAVLGAFLVWAIVEHSGMSPFLALAIVVPVMGALGWLLQRVMLERSLRAGALVPLLTTFGLGIVIQNLLFAQFGADTRSLAPAIGDLAYDSWSFGSQIYVGQLAGLIFVVAVALLGGLQLFLARTPLGRAIRATAEDPDTAELVGVDSRAVYAAAAAIAVMTVAIAGTFLGMRAAFAPYAGPAQLIFAFEAVVIGGLGSMWGTLLGGIVLGVAQNVGAQIAPNGFLIAGHAVFLVVLGGRLLLQRMRRAS